MGKKRYNWKSREVVKTIIDDSATNKIVLDLKVDGHYDNCNELVLPSEKRKTKVIGNKNKVGKILSKKHRKKLEKIVERKQKKQNRATLLEELTKVNIDENEIKKLTSIASIQTKGLKRYFQEEYNSEQNKKRNTVINEPNITKINSIKGKKTKAVESKKNNHETNTDPNVVGFDSSESDISVSSSEDEEANNTIINPDNSVIEIPPEVEEVIESKSIIEKIETIPNDSNKNTVNIKTEIPRKPAVYVNVLRDNKVQAERLKLPILSEEQTIMETINHHPITVVIGETGSGKTTQIPQFLYEAGYSLNGKLIGVTEPRRVAAQTMSKRLCYEMNLPSTSVSYLIRFEGNCTNDTKIKFMTDGVLLKEIQTDFLLTKYSVIILDEIHERTIYTDILIGLLSRIVLLRRKKSLENQLKLILMSATLDLNDFLLNEKLFRVKPEIVNVDTRQFPVTIHFNRRTKDDYLNEAYNKAIKIHQQLPDGGILIFVTGQQEVNALVKRLKRTFPIKNRRKLETESIESEQKAYGTKKRFSNVSDKKKRRKLELNSIKNADNSEEDDNFPKKINRNRKREIVIPKINLDDYGLPGDTELLDDDDDDNNLLSSDDEENELETINLIDTKPLWVLPMYSILSSEEQSKVFKQPPNNHRLCVISTNISETSITIPNIKYVIDTGRTKIKLYDKLTGVTNYIVTFVSKASAKQRAGRAGRVSTGHCYRLYSSAVYNSFIEFNEPEIKRKSIEDLYLKMKSMGIGKIENFPFPTKPDLLQLKQAEKNLKLLGALDNKTNEITDLGKAIAKFPLLPKYGKMLALSHQFNLLEYTICLVSALSVQEVLLEVPLVNERNVSNLKEERKKLLIIRRKWASTGNQLLLGDCTVLLKSVGGAEYANTQNQLTNFCKLNGLREKALIEIRRLRLQLTNDVKMNLLGLDLVVNPKLKPPTDLEAKLLRQIMLAGLGNQIARKIPCDELNECMKHAYQANNIQQLVFIHRNSVLRRIEPEFVVYQEIYEINDKLYLRGITGIEPEWLPKYVPNLCNLSKPLTVPEPCYLNDTIYCTVNGTFGEQAWVLPNCQIEYPMVIERYKWFAKFFLDGLVFSDLKKYSECLLSSSSLMVKSWAKLQSRTDVLLKCLIREEVSSKEKLQEVWLKEEKYLLREYLNWLPQSAEGEVSLMWPPRN